jgi:hypothetical protein
VLGRGLAATRELRAAGAALVHRRAKRVIAPAREKRRGRIGREQRREIVRRGRRGARFRQVRERGAEVEEPMRRDRQHGRKAA